MIRGTQSTEINAYVVPSRDGDYRYLYYHTQVELGDGSWKEEKPHGALAMVEYVGKEQTLTDYGTYKYGVDMYGADIPIVEMTGQFPRQVLENMDQSNIVGPFVSSSVLRDDIPVVQDFNKYCESI